MPEVLQCEKCRHANENGLTCDKLSGISQRAARHNAGCYIGATLFKPIPETPEKPEDDESLVDVSAAEAPAEVVEAPAAEEAPAEVVEAPAAEAALAEAPKTRRRRKK